MGGMNRCDISVTSLILITNLKGGWGKPLYNQDNGQGGQNAAHSSTDFATAELKHSFEAGW